MKHVIRVSPEVERYRRIWYQGPYSISTDSKRYLRKIDRRRARRERREVLRRETELYYEEGCLEFQEAMGLEAWFGEDLDDYEDWSDSEDDSDYWEDRAWWLVPSEYDLDDPYLELP